MITEGVTFPGPADVRIPCQDTSMTPEPSCPRISPWEHRFRSPRIGLPRWAADAPHRCACIATANGTIEVHSWDQSVGALVQATARREGTFGFTIDPSGEWLWWFDDLNGNERGVWRRQPFGSAPDEGAEDATGLPPSRPAGLAIGRLGLMVVGSSGEDHGYQVHLVNSEDQTPIAILYQNPQAAKVSALSEDGTLLALLHSEHGDSRHPALRVLRVADGSVVSELWDGPGQGLNALGFAPCAGDQRLLVRHERHERAELLVWDPTTGTEVELSLGLPGEVADADWYRDGRALLVTIDHLASTRLHRVEFDESGLQAVRSEPVGPSDGTVLAATTRPDQDAWLLWSSACEPPTVRTLCGDLVVAPPGERAPLSVPVESFWVAGPGGPVHALLRRPPTPAHGPWPLLIDVHGGPAEHDTDAFRPGPCTWVDNGFAVVQVNYRGSTGYGPAWRDALKARVGHTELADLVAVRDQLVEAGVANAEQIVLAGTSWGGYLALLGVGIYPDRWAAGIAASPVADYVAAYEDETEDLKAFDRSLFNGSPRDMPAKYRDSSPITYADAIRVPVLILAGRNDPRCPIRQVENYVAELTDCGKAHEVYRYDAGHGSLVDDERVRQMRVKLEFVRRHLSIGLNLSLGIGHSGASSRPHGNVDLGSSPNHECTALPSLLADFPQLAAASVHLREANGDGTKPESQPTNCGRSFLA